MTQELLKIVYRDARHITTFYQLPGKNIHSSLTGASTALSAEYNECVVSSFHPFNRAEEVAPFTANRSCESGLCHFLFVYIECCLHEACLFLLFFHAFRLKLSFHLRWFSTTHCSLRSTTNDNFARMQSSSTVPSPTRHSRKCDLKLHIGGRYRPLFTSEDGLKPKKVVIDHLVPREILIASSPVFKAMLSGRFQEAQLAFDTDDPPTLELPEDHPRAMVILCRILCEEEHPIEEQDYPSIRRIATVSNKYDCNKHVRAWFRGQLLYRTHGGGVWTALSGNPRDLANAPISAYLLDDARTFDTLSRIAVETMPGAFLYKDTHEYRLFKILMPETFFGKFWMILLMAKSQG